MDFLEIKQKLDYEHLKAAYESIASNAGDAPKFLVIHPHDEDVLFELKEEYTDDMDSNFLRFSVPTYDGDLDPGFFLLF